MELTETNNNNSYKQPEYLSKEEILLNPYTQTVKEFMLAMIEARYNYEDNSELCSMAIQATEKLIEKVNSKVNG